MSTEPSRTQIGGHFSVALLGARMHYAVPRMLAAADMLDRLFTDLPYPPSWGGAVRHLDGRRAPVWARRLASRLPPGLTSSQIMAFPAFGWEYVLRKRLARTAGRRAATYLWAGRKFCQLILARGLGSACGVYTFNSAGLEVLRSARARGLFNVMEQTIVPLPTEWRILAEEYEFFPRWEAAERRAPEEMTLCDREQAEWKEADLIVCGSDFVRAGIRDCGGPFERCAVVPYGVELPGRAPVRADDRNGRPLRVLFAGTVGLRKGAQYVLQVARLLKGVANWRMVGPVEVSPHAVTRLSQFVELTGAVPRSEMRSHYDWADVFLLPSVCEGSATVCYEALAAGLPVITTPNAGSIVRDGIDGFIVPIRDPEAITAKLLLLRGQPDLLFDMSQNASKRSLEYTLDKYGARLTEELSRARRSKSTVSAPAGTGL